MRKWRGVVLALWCGAVWSDAPPPDAAAPATESTPAPEPYPQTVAVPQAQAPQPPPAPPVDEKRVLEEVVVTSQKTRQSLSSVPISVSAISGEQIKLSAITEATDLVQYTPNIRFQQGANSLSSVSIRGFGSPPAGRNLEPSVGLSIDDVFYGRTSFTNDAVFDVERLEVLRGPQGTLFGKNTIAGVLSFTTGEPSMHSSGYTTLAAGSLAERRAEGAAGFPLIDERLAARIALRARDRRVGVYNTTTGHDVSATDVGGRAKLRWQVTDSLTADVSYLDSISRTDGVGFVLERATPRSLERFRKYDPETVADPFAGKQAFDIDEYSDRRTRSTSAKLEQKVGDFLFARDMIADLIVNEASISTPYRFDTDFSPIPLTSLSSQGPETYRQRSLELRTSLTTPVFGLPFDWVAGLFLFRSEADVTQLSNFNRNALIDFLLAGAGPIGNAPALPDAVRDRLVELGLPTDISSLPSVPPLFPQGQDREYTTNILNTRTRSQAAFVQTTAHVTDDLALIAGLRVGRENQDGYQSSQCVPSGGPPCFGAPVFARQQNFTNRGVHEESDVSPKFAVTYKLMRGVTLFGNWARGYKSGGFSGPLLAPADLEYRPERARALEGGLKTRLFSGSLMLNVSGFLVKFDDLQVEIFNGVNFVTLNAAKATAKGVEMDFRWLPPLKFLNIAGSFGMADVAYDSFPCAPGIAGSNSHAPGCETSSTPSPNAPPTQDLTGRETPYTPRFTASLTPTARFPLIPSWGLGGLLGVDLLYQSSQYLDTDLDPAKFQEATLKVNARFAISGSSRPWMIVFNAKNVTGEKERAFITNQQQLVGNYVSIPYAVGPLYSLDLRYNW